MIQQVALAIPIIAGVNQPDTMLSLPEGRLIKTVFCSNNSPELDVYIFTDTLRAVGFVVPVNHNRAFVIGSNVRNVYFSFRPHPPNVSPTTPVSIIIGITESEQLVFSAN